MFLLQQNRFNVRMDNIVIKCGFLLLTIVSFSTSSHIYTKRETGENESCPECNNNSLEIPISFGNEINKFELYSDYVHSMLDEDTIDQRDDIYLLVNGKLLQMGIKSKEVITKFQFQAPQVKSRINKDR